MFIAVKTRNFATILGGSVSIVTGRPELGSRQEREGNFFNFCRAVQTDSVVYRTACSIGSQETSPRGERTGCECDR